MCELLSEAIKQNNLYEAIKLCPTNMDAMISAMCEAAEYGCLDIVSYFVVRGANAKNICAIQKASKNGHLEVVKYLISLGGDGNEAMLIASCNGHLDIVKMLVALKVNIRHSNDYVIRMASKRGHLHIVKYLHSLGADITANDSDALQFASQMGHLDVVKYLVCKKADVRARDDRSVRLALENGHLEVATYLVSMGARISDQCRKTTFVKASRNGHLDVVKYLYCSNLPFRAIRGALDNAFENGHREIINYIYSLCGDTDFVLEMAVKYNYLDFVKLIARKGMRCYFMYDAVRCGNLEIVKHLMLFTYTTNNDREDCLALACELNHLEVAKFFMRDLKTKTSEHMMITASEKGHLEIVKLLVSNGSRIYNAIRKAILGSHYEVVIYLISVGADVNDIKDLIDNNLIHMCYRKGDFDGAIKLFDCKYTNDGKCDDDDSKYDAMKKSLLKIKNNRMLFVENIKKNYRDIVVECAK